MSKGAGSYDQIKIIQPLPTVFQLCLEHAEELRRFHAHGNNLCGLFQRFNLCQIAGGLLRLERAIVEFHKGYNAYLQRIMHVPLEISPDRGMALEGKDYRIRIKQKHPAPPTILSDSSLPL